MYINNIQSFFLQTQSINNYAVFCQERSRKNDKNPTILKKKCDIAMFQYHKSRQFARQIGLWMPKSLQTICIDLLSNYINRKLCWIPFKMLKKTWLTKWFLAVGASTNVTGSSMKSGKVKVRLSPLVQCTCTHKDYQLFMCSMSSFGSYFVIRNCVESQLIRSKVIHAKFQSSDASGF